MTGHTFRRPELSVILCTARRPGPLRRALEALCQQPLERDAFEVVVVEDGPEDGVREVVASFEGRLRVRHSSQQSAGIASARNHGLFLATGEIVLFLDDVEVATPGLLLAHQEAHRRNPDPAHAVLGATRLSVALAGDPLMHFALQVGCFLYAYPYLRDGDVLDETFFWPGRCSCKRSFLLERGTFDAHFRVGDDHAELGFRLSRHGFRVIYSAGAVSTLVDALDFDQFCAWLRDQGASRYLFARLHPERAAQDRAGVAAARAAWGRFGPAYEAILHSARSLDRTVRMSLTAGLEVSADELALLHRSYWAAFAASRIRGMVDQAREEREEFAPPPTPASARGAGAALDGQQGAPAVTIVIPVHDKVEHTRRCLELVARHAPPVSYEVVVVDDASTDGTAQLLREQGPPVRVLTQTVNEGFVAACNRGAAAARGRWILFLNNDTEPQPGWLRALLLLSDAEPEAGALGSQLVFPDGKLQEAGGIVFKDGSAWNFGRGDLPARAAYQRPCEVDYCSGASLMVRRDLFERLGGFDPRYAPAYYEDTDLCFGVRSLGYKVMYCPDSIVIHLEGTTAGRDLSAGVKRYQEVNRGKFLIKWREALARHEPNPSVTGRQPLTADRGRRLAEALVGEKPA